MKLRMLLVLCAICVVTHSDIRSAPSPFADDPAQRLERTCFQTGQPWSEAGDLRSDVAIVYGIGANLPSRIETWREHGYRIHVMTGVSWGSYQDYLYGKFDGINHEDEAQTDRSGNKISHGGDVYYMCPGTNYGKFLCVGIQRALDAGAEAVHLEEPEFWVRGGYSEGFKREWKNYYGEPWQPPHNSVDAQWRASKLKYFLYRRALQQVFDYVQDYNRRAGRKVRCYVPTHSLLNYAHWGIVSPESSLARLNGCDGYIAQVWTGTSRTPNSYRGQLRERTFETAFLEYGAMQNLVRATGRTVWYLNDPVEDNGNHDWTDYRKNWESTLVASLLHPEVWRYEVAPWPERVFNGRYPRRGPRESRERIPAAYATELQTAMNALNDMKQDRVEWDCGARGIGVLVSDSLMFERGEPVASDPHLGNVYGLALPLLKRGIPVTPVQLENVGIAGYLNDFKVLLLSYHGMKPLDPLPHRYLSEWVKQGGSLVICDDDADPYNQVREWWNTGEFHFASAREHLMKELGHRMTEVASTNLNAHSTNIVQLAFGRGSIFWLKDNPARLSTDPQGDLVVASLTKEACARAGLTWRETNYLLLRRGPYIVCAGLDESPAPDSRELKGAFINLFDPELQIQDSVKLSSGSRFLLLDLNKADRSSGEVLASACKPLVSSSARDSISLWVEGVANTGAVVLLRSSAPPRSVVLDRKPLESFHYSAAHALLWVRFENESRPRKLELKF